MRRTWLRDLRKEHGMTQEDLAQRMGKERSAISKYEAGVCDLSGRVLEAYADVFQKTMDEIYRLADTDRTPHATHGPPAPLPPPPTPRAAVHALPPRRRRASRAPH